MHSKLPNIGTSIFAEMSQMASAHGAINLSQGFPDFEVSPRLVELVNKSMQQGHNQYSPIAGVPALREAVGAKIEKLYGVAYDRAEEITITAGATQALATTMAALINEGDEVIVFEPAFDTYVPMIRLYGGKPVFVQLNLPDFRIDWEQVKRAVNANTRMIIINSPHNPSGSVFSREDFDHLKKLVSGSHITILSDEVYEHILYDGLQHISVSSLPELRDRSIVVSSFGKTFHTTGWRMGYVVAPAEYTKEIRKIHQFQVFSVSTPFQYALAEFLQYEEEYLGLAAFYQEKRDRFADMLAQTKFKLIPTRGTYFQNVSIADFADMPDTRFVNWLAKEIGVAAIPLSAFYHQKLDHKIIRFCFAKHENTLQEAVSRLKKVF